MSFKDHFSGHANAYARYRPDYPAELFAYLATLTPRREVALDCATGSGQAAVGLADYFSLVVASDGSVSQLQSAQQHPHVAYVGNLAEQPALRDGTVDLIVAAQAAHWFDHQRFYPEAKRVLKKGGAVALWTYGLANVEPQVDAIVHHFYSDMVGTYWPPERRWVESAYRDLPFPLQEVSAPTFQLQSAMGPGQPDRLHRHLVSGAALSARHRRRSFACIASRDRAVLAVAGRGEGGHVAVAL